MGSTSFGRNISVLPPTSDDTDRNEIVAENSVNNNKISSKKSHPRHKGGGWPKGKKRRKVHPNVNTPKAPATA